jgi:hypothetical protein
VNVRPCLIVRGPSYAKPDVIVWWWPASSFLEISDFHMSSPVRNAERGRVCQNDSVDWTDARLMNDCPTTVA